jgi:PPOX class probable F420-dependent enzyme
MSLLTPAQRQLFENPNFVNVATIAKDGTPRTTAIWVDIDGDDILLNAANSRQWLQNLRRNPNVALSIFDLHNPYNQVNLIGTVESISAVGGEEHIDKLAQKYTGHDYADHKADDPRQIVRIKISKVRQ